MTAPVAESFTRRNHDSSLFTKTFSTVSTPLGHSIGRRRPPLRRPGMPQFGNSGDKIWQAVAVARPYVSTVLQRDGGSVQRSRPHKEIKMNDQMQRRDFLQGVALVAGAAAATTLTEPAFAQTGLKPMTYEAKPLSLDPRNIKGISERVLVSHYENNYVGAVKRLNAIGAQLAELDFANAPNFVINGLKREELIAANSMILHEVYFDSLGGSAAPSGVLAEAIARDFGSLDRW